MCHLTGDFAPLSQANQPTQYFRPIISYVTPSPGVPCGQSLTMARTRNGGGSGFSCLRDRRFWRRIKKGVGVAEIQPLRAASGGSAEAVVTGGVFREGGLGLFAGKKMRGRRMCSRNRRTALRFCRKGGRRYIMTIGRGSGSARKKGASIRFWRHTAHPLPKHRHASHTPYENKKTLILRKVRQQKEVEKSV